MKTTKRNLIPVLVVLVFSILAVLAFPWGIKDKGHDALDCDMDFDDEQEIKLTPHELEESIGKFVIPQFTVHARSTAVTKLPMVIDKIEDEEFCILKDAAHALFGQNGDFLTALRMAYGLSVDKDSVILFYQPVALKRTDDQSTNFSTHVMDRPDDYRYYRVVGNKFRRLTDLSDTNGYFNRYNTQMKLRKSTNASTELLNDQDGHARSIVYSFQEIHQLIVDNNTNYLRTWNAIKKKARAPYDSSHFHEVLLGPENLQPWKSFDGKFANMGHLCPPSCGVEAGYIRFEMKP